MAVRPVARTATVVTDPSGAQPFGIATMSFDEALQRALEEERRAEAQSR
jgi:hypothetical protein